MRFVPIIALLGAACALAAAFATEPAVVAGAAGSAADTAAHAYDSTKRLLVPGRREAPAFGSDAPMFRYAAIQRGSIEQTITVTGALQPVKTIEVGSQLSGQLARVYVDFNDTVSKDQLSQRSSQLVKGAEVDLALDQDTHHPRSSPGRHVNPSHLAADSPRPTQRRGREPHP